VRQSQEWVAEMVGVRGRGGVWEVLGEVGTYRVLSLTGEMVKGLGRIVMDS